MLEILSVELGILGRAGWTQECGNRRKRWLGAERRKFEESHVIVLGSISNV
jgi:hypothetical protein